MHTDIGNQIHTQSDTSARPGRTSGRSHRVSGPCVRRDINDLPPVHVTEHDYRRLRALCSGKVRGIAGDVLRFLTRELDRARVCPDSEIPADAVTIGSRVIFRADAGEPLECRALIDREVRSAIGGNVSILSPLGVAMLGLRTGSSMRYFDRERRLKTVSIEGIALQPEAKERALRRRYRPGPYGQAAMPE